MFNKRSESNSVIVEYFNKKSALVASDSMMIRTSLKKCLTNLGMKIGNIYQASSMVEAQETCTTFKPNIAFVSMEINKESGEELLDLHMRTFPNRLDAAFFFVSNTNAVSNAYLMLESEVEAVLLTPFTNKNLEETILVALEKKITPTAYTKNLEDGKEQLFLGNDEKAIEVFDNAINESDQNTSAKSYKAALFIKNKNVEEGEKILKENYQSEKAHYQTLNELRKLYQKQNRLEDQYQIERDILENYPLNPVRLPELTNLSIRNQKYEDILDFIDVANNLKTKDPVIVSHVAAGLAICARYLVSVKKKDQAIVVTQKAGEFSAGKIGVLEHCVETLDSINETKVAIELLEKYKTDKTDEDLLQLLLFKLKTKGEPPQVVYGKGMECLNKGYNHQEIYETMIDSLVEAKSSYEKIEELVFSAMKDHPKLRDSLNKKLNDYKKISESE